MDHALSLLPSSWIKNNVVSYPDSSELGSESHALLCLYLDPGSKIQITFFITLIWKRLQRSSETLFLPETNKMNFLKFIYGSKSCELAGLVQDGWDPQSTYICRVQSSVWRLPKYWPPTPSPPSECVLPPHQRRGVPTRRAVRGWEGGQYLEDARHWIGLLQYNPSTVRPVWKIAKPGVFTDSGLS
jgi:hypothetical protein